MPNDQEFSDETLNSSAEEASIDKLPAMLRNWQVIEIDGEATWIEDEPVAQAETVGVRAAAISDHPDDVIVVGLDTRALVVNAGETATLQVALLNNGEHTARFTLYIEGWVNESWVAVAGSPGPLAGESLPVHVRLNQGERTTIQLALTPPRSSSVRAGEYAFAIVVRTSEDPARFHRLGATLRLNPIVDFTLGQVRPQPLAFSWFKRANGFVLPLTNRGNMPVTFRLQALDVQRQWQLVWGVTGGARLAPAKAKARVTIQPGQKIHIPGRVRARRLAWFGVDKQQSALRLNVAPSGEPSLSRTAIVPLTRAPLLGPWHLVALFSLCVAAIMGVSLVGITGLMLWHSSIASARANQPVPIQTSAVLPLIALVVNVPAPAQAPPVSVDNAAHQTTGPLADVASTPMPHVPMVQADQVTGPGTPAPLAPMPTPAIQPVALRPAAMHKLTYQQMFQEIGRRYDLNWRLLAAQAYVESSFDATALGQKGALGLMQVMPDTWREWSPTVDATDPFDTYSNVLVAAVYLDYLRTTLSKHGHTQVEWVLVAYNWGIDKVLKHLDNNLGWDDLPPASRQYAQDIMRIAETIPVN